MIAHAFFAPRHRVRNVTRFFLTSLLLLSFAALAHPLSQTAKQARPLVSAPSKLTPQPKSVSQLKVGDVIRARDYTTGNSSLAVMTASRPDRSMPCRSATGGNTGPASRCWEMRPT